MAVNDSRSLNYEIAQGMVDNTYKKVRPGWGGIIEPTTGRRRLELHGGKFDVVEAPVKVAGDGTLVPGSR